MTSSLAVSSEALGHPSIILTKGQPDGHIQSDLHDAVEIGSLSEMSCKQAIPKHGSHRAPLATPPLWRRAHIVLTSSVHIFEMRRQVCSRCQATLSSPHGARTLDLCLVVTPFGWLLTRAALTSLRNFQPTGAGDFKALLHRRVSSSSTPVARSVRTRCPSMGFWSRSRSAAYRLRAMRNFLLITTQ
jgi:hypothetical protein